MSITASDLKDWLVGYVSMVLGIVATLAITFLFIIVVIAPVFYSAVLTIDMLGIAPLIVGGLAILGLSIWFCWRFLIPSYVGILKRTGVVMQRLSSVRPVDTMTVVWEGLLRLWSDCLQLLRWLRVRA